MLELLPFYTNCDVWFSSALLPYSFLEFWLNDMVNLPNCWSPQRAVAMMLVPLLCTAAAG